METVRQRFENRLIAIGMNKGQAKEVMDISIPIIDAEQDDYQITWDRPSSEYPDIIYKVLFKIIKEEGLKWIEEYEPQAWFKTMFQPIPTLKN